MRIQQIDVFSFELPVKGKAYTMAKTSVTHLDTTLVKITADNGLVGWHQLLMNVHGSAVTLVSNHNPKILALSPKLFSFKYGAKPNNWDKQCKTILIKSP